MCIKTVFGLFQGNKNRNCELLTTLKSGESLWLIKSQDDRSICIDGPNELIYRICPEYQLKQLQPLIDSDKVLEQLFKVVENTTTNFNTKAFDVNQKFRVDASLFYLMGKGDVYQEILKHNSELEQQQKLQREQKEQQKESEQAEAITEQIEAAKSELLKGELIACKDLVLLADHVEVKIPIRTRGWLLNTGSHISTTQQTFMGKGQGSQKAFEVVHSVIKLLENKLA